MSTTTLQQIARRFRGRVGQARATGDEGFAMILVLGVAFTLTALLSAGFVYAQATGQKGPQKTVYDNLAYNAALAGVNDFAARMNNYKGSTSYCSDPDTTNEAYTGWKNLPNRTDAAYRYQVISDCSVATGDTSDVIVKVSGIAGPKVGKTQPSVRTLTAEIKRPGFRDYVFFTDKEQADPSLKEYSMTDAQRTWCKNNYNWAAGTALGTSEATSIRNSSSKKCVNINFGGGDVLNGKVHTNDVIMISSGGATFTQPVTIGCIGTGTSDPCKTSKYIPNGGTPTLSTPIQASTTLAFPATDASVELSAIAGGCVYYGPTRIVMLSSGKMSIASPGSTATTACPIGTNVNQPANGVIFVDDVPTTSTKFRTPCPDGGWVTNSTSGATNTGGTSYPVAGDWDITNMGMDCNQGNVWIEGVMAGVGVVGATQNLYITGNLTYANGLTGANAKDGLGLVAQNSISFYHPYGDVPTTTTTTTPGYCQRYRQSTGMIKTTETQGTTGSTAASRTGCGRWMNRSVTTSTSNSSTSTVCSPLNTNTGSSYCQPGTWYPAVDNTTTTYAEGELCPTTCGQNLTVQAAMLSISHSIRVPYYNADEARDMGTLTINGSLAQFFRGPVRNGTKGYVKSYNYDPRLKNIVLPGFPAITSTYGQNNFIQIKPQYTGNCFGNWRKVGEGC